MSMPYEEAVRVFARHGVWDAALLSADGLKKARTGIALRHHPDRGGDAAAMAAVNAAYDALKAGDRRPRAPLAGDDGGAAEYVVWGWDGGSTLTRGPAAVCQAHGFRDLAGDALAAMRRGFRHQRAILAQPKADPWSVLLLYANGHCHDPPLRFPHHGNGDPSSDAAFVRMIREKLGRAA